MTHQKENVRRLCKKQVYICIPQEYVYFLGYIKFANETIWYTNQEICAVDSSQVLSLFN